jgi:hypothetical protein
MPKEEDVTIEIVENDSKKKRVGVKTEPKAAPSLVR